MTDQSNSLNLIKNVFIEGDKIGFNSKMAIEKFKTCVKKMDETKSELNLEELQKKYIKPEFKLEIIKYDPCIKDIIIKISINNKYEENRKVLKEKIKLLKKDRTNSDYHKAKQNENVSDEILKEYNNLKKMTKMPVPDPSEILSNPEQYKPILSMVLNNKMINKMGVNHPYIKYFKLIAQKLNIQPELDSEPEPDIKNTVVSANELSQNEDTDEED
jgi:hypothetical protein